MGKIVRGSSSPEQRRESAAPGQAAPAGRAPGEAGAPPRDPSDCGPGAAATPSGATSRPAAQRAVPEELRHLLPASPTVSPSSIVAIARVLRAHGVIGEFKVQILCAGLEHFLECVDTGEVLLQREGLPGAFSVHVDSVRPIPEGALVSLVEVETREAVEALRGAILGLPEDRLPACEPDTYYFHELEGLRVVAAEDGAEIGTVVRVEESPGHDQLVVRPKSTEEPAKGTGEGDAAGIAAGPMDDMDKMDRMDGMDQEASAEKAGSGGGVAAGGTDAASAASSVRPRRGRRGPRKKAGAGAASRDFLIPFVGAFVARVDLAGGRIEVTLPPGFAESQR